MIKYQFKRGEKGAQIAVQFRDWNGPSNLEGWSATFVTGGESHSAEVASAQGGTVTVTLPDAVLADPKPAVFGNVWLQLGSERRCSDDLKLVLDSPAGGQHP